MKLIIFFLCSATLAISTDKIKKKQLNNYLLMNGPAKYWYMIKPKIFTQRTSERFSSEVNSQMFLKGLWLGKLLCTEEAAIQLLLCVSC